MDLNAASEKKRHSKEILLDFCFNDIRKRYSLKTHQKLERVFTFFVQNKLGGQPPESIKFYCKGKEISGHETAESCELVNKDRIVATVIGSGKFYVIFCCYSLEL